MAATITGTIHITVDTLEEFTKVQSDLQANTRVLNIADNADLFTFDFDIDFSTPA